MADHIERRLLQPARLEEILCSVLDRRQERAERRATHITKLRKRASWLMQGGTRRWEAAGFLGMSVETLLERYGHHHPDHLSASRKAFANTMKLWPKLWPRRDETLLSLGRSGRI